MSALLTLDTARGGGGNLVLTAVGEIDLSNIDAFSQALIDSTATAAGSGERLTVVDFTAALPETRTYAPPDLVQSSVFPDFHPAVSLLLP